MSVKWIQPTVALGPERMLTQPYIGLSEGRIAEITFDAPNASVEKLPETVLVPGFVNAHSHAFQRSLRGQTEYLQPGREDEDFWPWRALMYERANSLDCAGLYTVAKRLYEEMLAAGYTHVGEFHYVHHKQDGSVHEADSAVAQAIAEAASEAGIRVTLLMVLYARGGINQPASHAQRRFLSRSFDSYLRLVDDIESYAQGKDQVAVGYAPHSIRAVPLQWLKELAGVSKDKPVHMHVCEQPAEIASSLEHLGQRPLAALEEIGLLTPRFVGVHATHMENADWERLSQSGAQVCVCPTTEANLGDGVFDAVAATRHGIPLSIGSDSHCVISPYEELRLIENNLRLTYGRRNVLAASVELQPTPARRRIAPYLLRVGGAGGARALGVARYGFEVGAVADFVALSMKDFALRDVPEENLAEAIVFSADTRAVSKTMVGGKWVFGA